MQYHPLGSIYSAMFLSGLVQYMLNFDAVFFNLSFFLNDFLKKNQTQFTK